MKWILPLLSLMLCAGLARADVFIAGENFDGGAVGLMDSTVPTLDGGGGDTHAVGATAAWPTTGSTPFSLTDNSTGDVGDTTFYAGDTEGIFGTAADDRNMFLGISDSDEFGDTTASWMFDISGVTDPLHLRIGMGSMEGSSFSYGSGTKLTFTVSIDGGPVQTAFDVVVDVLGDGYIYRPLDDGVVITANDNALSVSGDNPVAKRLAETGLSAPDTFLDKTPASGPGAGQLDTFVTRVNGLGDELELTLISSIPYEGAAIDNIGLYAIPEPASLALFGIASLLLFIRRTR